MTLEAEKGHLQGQEVVVYGTVGTMTGGAVLGIFRMFIEKGPLLFSVTFCTGLLDGFSPEGFSIGRTVLLVAVGADDPLFRDGMVTGQEKFRLNLRMTGKTHPGDLFRLDLEVRSGMDIVAVEAGDIRCGVLTNIPVVKIEGGIARVALQADEGLGLGGQFLDRNKGVVITGGLFPGPGIPGDLPGCQTGNGKTSRAVAGFAVDKGEAGFFRELCPHGTCIEIATNLVVEMTGGQALIRADIVRIQSAGQETFIFCNRQDRFGNLEGFAGGQEEGIDDQDKRQTADNAHESSSKICGRGKDQENS